jgi:TolA-binding protein
MNKKLIGLLALTAVISVHAQDSTEQLSAAIQRVDKGLSVVERNQKANFDSIQSLKKQLSDANAASKVMSQRLQELQSEVSTLKSQNGKVEESLVSLSTTTEQKNQTLSESLSNLSKVSIAAMVATLILLGAVYWFLGRRYEGGERVLTGQIDLALKAVKLSEEKIARADTALADSLFDVLSKIKAASNAAAPSGTTSTPVDHNLPLKLSDEIHRMRKRLSSLPSDTKGLTPLHKSLERLEAEIADLGYEIIDLTGKPYSENLSVKARFVPSDDMAPDQKMISKVVTPQVNYQGVMIRMADIEVSIGS